MIARLFPALLLPIFAACSGPTDPAELAREGVAALNANNAESAYAPLHRAVRELPQDHPRYLEARVGLCRAMVHRDAGLCVQEFDAMVRESDQVGMGDVELITHELLASRAYSEAAKVLKSATEHLGTNERLRALLKEAGDAAKAAGHEEALKDLKGLGYT